MRTLISHTFMQVFLKMGKAAENSRFTSFFLAVNVFPFFFFFDGLLLQQWEKTVDGRTSRTSSACIQMLKLTFWISF